MGGSIYYLAWAIAGLLIVSFLYIGGAINFWTAFALYWGVLFMAFLLLLIPAKYPEGGPTPVDMMKNRF